MEATVSTPQPSAGELHYYLPESAHHSLAHIRDELDMLVTLTQRSSSDEDETIELSSIALSHLFHRMWLGMAGALEVCQTPSAHKGQARRSVE